MGRKKTEVRKLDKSQNMFFLDQFRHARHVALGDAEAFLDIINVIERLGGFLAKKKPNLHDCKDQITKWVKASGIVPLGTFSKLYESVTEARNDALHQGAFARHLTIHAVELALILEDVLSKDLVYVADFMTRNPVFGEPWQPISFVRQQLLANSFSCLPVKIQEDWHIVTDRGIASYLRKPGNRDERLRKPLLECIELLTEAKPIKETTSPMDALDLLRTQPLLLVHKDESPHIILGVVTAFDLL